MFERRRGEQIKGRERELQEIIGKVKISFMKNVDEI